jgi:cytochrome b involved in lipid metabolism
LEPFLDKHPGGRHILLLARDRFEDCTFVFEAHHHNYQRARAIIRKFEVSEAEAKQLNEHAKTYRLSKEKTNEPAPVSTEDALEFPTKLLSDDSFYSVLR